MQIGEVLVSASRTVNRHQIRLELDQIARDEPRGKAEVAQRMDQKPAGIAAGPLGQRQGFLGGLHARLHPDDIADFLRQLPIQPHDEIYGAQRLARDPVQEGLQHRTRRRAIAVDHQVFGQLGRIVERPGFGAVFDKEIKGIVDRHVRRHVHFDPQLGHRAVKDIARQPVAIGVLLVVHEVVGGRHFQRMGDHARAAMGRGAQADNLRTQRHRAVVKVMGQVVDAGEDRHGGLFSGQAWWDSWRWQQLMR